MDAPLVVPNETGQRIPERLIGRAFGGEPPRAMRLAERFGWVVDPRRRDRRGGHGVHRGVPHHRLDYTKGNDQRRLPGSQDW